MRLLPRLLAAAALVLLVAAPAGATEADAIADAVFRTGVHVDAGAEVDAAELRALADELARAGHAVGFVALADAPAEGETRLAEVVLQESGGQGTVVVRSPAGVGAASADHSGSEIDRALDASFEQLRDAPLDGFASFARSLTGAAVGGEADGTGGGFPTGLVVLGVLVLLVVGLVVVSRRRGTARRAAAVAAQRDAIRADLSAMAQRIVDLDDTIRLSEDATARAHHSDAVATYTAAQDELETSDPAALAPLAERVRHARWQLDTAAALLDGRPAPPEPRPEPPPPAPAAPTSAPTSGGPPSTASGVEPRAESASRPARRGGGALGGILGVLGKGMATGMSGEATRRRRRTTRRATTTRRTSSSDTPRRDEPPSTASRGRRFGAGRSGTPRKPRRNTTKGRGGRQF